MANKACPLPYLRNREQGFNTDLKSQFYRNRLNVAKNLYRRDLVCHFGCVNAIEFSNNGELLVSGGDDRRVMLWKFGQAIIDYGKPVAMKSVHQSNIFCLGITSDNQKIFSGGNDDIVMVHDIQTTRVLEVLQHQRAVCGLSIDPFNERVVVTAGNDGRLLLFDTRQSVHESLVISRSRRSYHGVMYHPQQSGVLVSGNARDGVSLWDLRTPKHPIMRYNSGNGTVQNCMSVRFNSDGTKILALRRRMSPALYAIHKSDPIAEFYHQDYYNSCTMKSCAFAGEGDRYVLSGSDDFNLYMWKIPELDLDGEADAVVDPPHIVLYSHRSIVNQVRYNPQYCVIASSGVEKIIKVWSAIEYPNMRGTLLEEAQGSDNPREIYSHEDYVSLVHHSGQYISHNYSEQSTSEDPRMMAFFDSLVQRELECLAEESDSLDGSSSPASHRSNVSESSDSEQLPADFVALPPKRPQQNGTRSQRCPNRLARAVAKRYPKNPRHQRRGFLNRRSKQFRSKASVLSRTLTADSSLRGCRRVTPRHSSRLSAPSSERTDDDEPRPRPVHMHTAIRTLRRRAMLTRTHKRKSKCPNYRKVLSRTHTAGSTRGRDISDNSSFITYADGDNLAVPSTSTGYRGQSSALFRIAEADSDDDMSVSGPVSPRQPPNAPENLVGIIPTPINGSRDTIEQEERTPPDTRRIVRRSRRNGRISIRRSDTSDSPPPKDAEASTSVMERLSPNVGYNRTVARLMNETNESELESSCSTESSSWVGAVTPDSGVGTVAGSSSRHTAPQVDVSDDPEYQTVKFRQRVKKARRNYRDHLDSDSN